MNYNATVEEFSASIHDQPSLLHQGFGKFQVDFEVFGVYDHDKEFKYTPQNKEEVRRQMNDYIDFQRAML